MIYLKLVNFVSISLLIPKELLLIEYMESLYKNSNVNVSSFHILLQEIRRNMEEYLSYGTSSQVTYNYYVSNCI
jgi:hypothetical protein